MQDFLKYEVMHEVIKVNYDGKYFSSYGLKISYNEFLYICRNNLYNDSIVYSF